MSLVCVALSEIVLLFYISNFRDFSKAPFIIVAYCGEIDFSRQTLNLSFIIIVLFIYNLTKDVLKSVQRQVEIWAYSVTWQIWRNHLMRKILWCYQKLYRSRYMDFETSIAMGKLDFDIRDTARMFCLFGRGGGGGGLLRNQLTLLNIVDCITLSPVDVIWYMWTSVKAIS